MFFKIALRNVFRNKRRTFFSLGVIMLGVAIMYLVLGFFTDSIESIKRSLVEEIGSVQIADPRLWDNSAKGYEFLIQPETLEHVTALFKDDTRVTGQSAQIGFAGLIGNEKGSTLIVGRGLVPGNPIEDYHHYIIDGQGQPLNGETAPQIIIGRKMAETLNVRPGEIVTIATGTARGTFNAASAQIVGILRYNSTTQEGQFGVVPLWFAQKLLKTSGVERILIQLHDLDQAETFARDLQAKLDQAGLALRARPWQELAGFYDSVKAFWGVFSALSQIGVFILVLFSVLEVLTMSFLERTREVGTIRAIGTKRRQVFSIFMLEGVMIGLLGGALGLLTGMALAGLINGSQFGWIPPGAIESVPIQIAMEAAVAAVPCFVALVSTTLGTLYPAWKTSRLNIVHALSYV
jgi:putative ABC transport system permease protein